MANNKRQSVRDKRNNDDHSVEHKKGRSLWRYFLTFLVGGILTSGLVLAFHHKNKPDKIADAGKRTVLQLLALSDAELEKIDVLELNLAVAREVKGAEKIDYNRYSLIVEGWTEQFSRWLVSAEYEFHKTPYKWENDIDFFRLGMLAQFLDQVIGIAYNEEQKYLKAIRYKNLGDLFLHGLIDTKRGTCGTMSTLHVTIGRRLGWPVSLACIDSHFVCRYNDGKKVYNFETTNTGHGGFSVGTDTEYIEKEKLAPMSTSSGSDLRSLSAREMLGAFIALRGRYYNDTNQVELADSDYTLARWAFPKSRIIYIKSFAPLVWRGTQLFESSESGHPLSFVDFLQHQFGNSMPSASANGTGAKAQTENFDGLAELRRVNAINEARKAQRIQQRQNVSVTERN